MIPKARFRLIEAIGMIPVGFFNFIFATSTIPKTRFSLKRVFGIDFKFEINYDDCRCFLKYYKTV